MRASVFAFYPIVVFCFSICLFSPPLSHAELPSLVKSVRFSDPIYFCGEKVPLETRGVRPGLEKEVLLALWDRPQVILWLKRATKYFPHIERILKKEGLPEDLKYVAVIESALRPHVRSSKGALGFWQFLRSTGRMYGLEINAAIDERRNIFKSTKAACRYLKDLYSDFDSWFLALAGYNMGENGLKRQIEIQKTRDFYSLYLPLETQRYVFKAVAAKIIIENAAEFGFLLNRGDCYPVFSFDRVNINSSRRIPVNIIADAAGVPFKTIKEMNPEIRGYTLSRGGNTVLVPKGAAGDFKRKFEQVYAEWEKAHPENRHHRVREGENLTMIARKYGVSLLSVLKWNNLSYQSVIHPGDTLVIKK